MFRKKFDTKPAANLKGSERKRLLSKICQNFKLDVNSPIKSTIVPKDVRCAKIMTYGGSKGLVYSDADGTPLWLHFEKLVLEDNGKGTVGSFLVNDLVVPTLFTLWKCPVLVPTLYTPELTIDHLQSGAALMVPGIFDPLPESALKGSIVKVCTLQNPYVPVGVGITLTDCSAAKLDPDNDKGKAASIVSVIDDKLCTSIRGTFSVPPADALKQLMEQQPWIVVPTEDQAEPQDQIEDLHNSSNEPQERTEGQDDEGDENNEVPTTEEKKELTTSELTQEVDLTVDEDDAPPALTTNEIDIIFEKALLQTLKKASEGQKIECPIPGSVFLSANVQPNLMVNNEVVNMKKTSWKKASKYFKAMEKKGLLKCKDKGGEVVIQSMAGKENKTVADFVVYKVRKPKPVAKTDDENDNAEHALDVAGNNKNSQITSFAEYFRPRAAAADVFIDLNHNPSAYYEPLELRKILQDYVAKHNLVDKKSAKQVVADARLAKALGLGSNVEDVKKMTVLRDQLVPSLQKMCSVFHKINVDGTDQKQFAKGPIPSIMLLSEKRAGRKVVTKIENLEPFHIDPRLFAEELRVICAGSTAVNPIKDGSDLLQVLVQGNQIKQITAALEKRGIRSNWFKITDKAGGGKRK